MNFDFQRWIPLTVVVILSAVLVHFSLQSSEETDPPVQAPIPLPPTPKEYIPPANIRIPFDYEVFISTIPPRIATEETEISTSAAQGLSAKAKTPKKDEPVIFINGIIWSPVTPLVSINGKILAEGGMLNKDVKVIKIMPNRVRLRIKNQVVDKKP